MTMATNPACSIAVRSSSKTSGPAISASSSSSPVTVFCVSTGSGSEPGASASPTTLSSRVRDGALASSVPHATSAKLKTSAAAMVISLIGGSYFERLGARTAQAGLQVVEAGERLGEGVAFRIGQRDGARSGQGTGSSSGVVHAERQLGSVGQCFEQVGG